MMIKFNLDFENINNNFSLDIDKIKQNTIKIFDYLLNLPEIKQEFCLKEYEYKTLAFDILFCDGEKTHQINKQYRNKDYSADIITFAVFADSDISERFVLDGEINLGEIIIALDKIDSQSKEKQISFENELYFFISHGIMHLLGFDHQTEKDFDFVVNCQKKSLKNIGIEYDKI